MFSSHHGRRAGRYAQGAIRAVAASLLCAPMAWAAPPIGPQGSIGPSSALSAGAAVSPAGGAGAGAGARAGAGAGAGAGARAGAGAGNHIEISGNSASSVGCAEGGAVSVNSVDVDSASLKGRTVIVQGRNVTDVRSEDCAKPQGSESSSQGAPQAPVQINSVRIR